MQSRSTFDGIPQKTRERIRRRITSHDEVPVSPYLGLHGQAPELPQFFLGDANSCPVTLLTREDAARNRR
jgi:FPC/CPF motif-containing protein YcgG